MMCDDLEILNRELDRLFQSSIAEGEPFNAESHQPSASESWNLTIISGNEAQCKVVQELTPSARLISESPGWFPEEVCTSQPCKAACALGLMLSDLDPLLPSSSNPFHLDLQGESIPKSNNLPDLHLENDVIPSIVEIASSQSSVTFESEPNLDNMESSSPATVLDDKADQDNEETLKAVRPTSKEFKKTWGFRRTTIAKREGGGDAEMEATTQVQQHQLQQLHQQLQQLKQEQQSTSNQSLRRSGRQPKRTERVEEFMTTVRRNRGRKSAPAILGDTSETSCPVTDVETASEGSVESMAEIKSDNLRSDPCDIEEPMVTGGTDLKDDDDSSSDSDALTLKELQDRLRKRQSVKTTAETVVPEERPIKVEPPPPIKVEPPPPIKVEPPPPIKVEPPATPERKITCPVSVAQECTESVQVKKEDTDSPISMGNKDQEADLSPQRRPESEVSDASTLYCICRQPHNKRFMICCDRCEEWFHGDCVGISEARGQLLEWNEEDYICPNCTLLPVKLEPVSESDLGLSKLEQPSTGGRELCTSGIADQKSVDQGIKGRIEKTANPSGKKKLKIFQPVSEAPVFPKCIGPGCSNVAQPDSVYCGHDCILKHAAATMKFLSSGKETKLKEKVKSKPEKVTPPKPPVAAKSQSGQKRPAPEKKGVKMKKMLVMVSKMEMIAATAPSEPMSEDSTPSWASDHNYNAVEPENTSAPAAEPAPLTAAPAPPAATPAPAAIASSVFYKSGKAEGENKPVEPAAIQNATASTALPSMKKRIAALPRIPMLKKTPPSASAENTQAPIRLSPLNTNTLTMKSPLTAASLAPRIVSASKQPSLSTVVAALSSKNIIKSPSSTGGVKKTEAPSASPSYTGGVKGTEAPFASPSSVGAAKTEVPSASPSSGGGVKKTQAPSTAPVSAGVVKRTDGPSTSFSTATKPTTNPSQSQPNLQMRLNIRRSLKEILWKRVGDSDDLVMLESEVAKVAMNIEKEMFGLFRETDSRYKSKYRNLMLNLKDPKNQGLFHRVLREDISLSKLVRLKPEELISKRLSSWKSRPIKSTSESKNKSHMDQRGSDGRRTLPDMEDSPPVSDSDDPDQPPQQEPPKPAAPEKIRAALPDIFSSMLNDTTNQHRAHLFDLNCKICTGQVSISEDDVTARRPKTLLTAAKKSEQKPKSDFRIKTESSASIATPPPPVEEVPETAEEKVTSTSETDPQPNVDKPPLPQGSNSAESSLPKQGPIYPDTSAASVVTTVTVSGRDPRTALNPSGRDPRTALSRPSATVTSTPEPSASPARDKTSVEETKPEMPKPVLTTFATPKSILMKPSSSDPRYLSSSMNLNISTSRSPQDGDTSLFLSRLGTIWKGFINMQSVAKFVTKAYPVSGCIDYLDEDLPDTIHIGGRISPKTVWDYVGKLKSSLSKELCLIRFHPATEEEEVAYISLYSYFSSRGRFGVVANNNRHIKDLYLIPLSAKDPIPSKLLPFDGPGLESSRPNLLLGLVICQKGKRPATDSEKIEEKRSKFQIQEDTDIIYSKATISSQPEKKLLKYQPYSTEPTVSASPPRSPKSLPPPPEPLTVPTPKLFSSLPSFKTELSTAAATTTTPSVKSSLASTEASSTSSAASSAAKTATPLEHILKTLFGKKKPFDAESESSGQVTDKATIDQKVRTAPMLDPIVQQFGKVPKEKVLEEEEDDRPYDPEEEYDPEKAFAMDISTGTEKLYKPEKPCEPLQQDDEAYDPEDETIFEEAKVIVDDFPNKISVEAKSTTVEVAGEYLTAITAASSLVEQQKMLEELNKQIEEQKRQLEAQEESLRQQRAAVGVSMAHFSVSDALMSPPPKSSLTNAELFQDEEKSTEETDASMVLDQLPHMIARNTDSKHTMDFWQTASRLLREANESSKSQVSQEKKSETLPKDKPLVSTEGKPEGSSLNQETKDCSADSQPMRSVGSKVVPVQDVSTAPEKNNKEKDVEIFENTATQPVDIQPSAMSKETTVSKPECQTVLPTPATTTWQPSVSTPSTEHQSSDSHKLHWQKNPHDFTSIPRSNNSQDINLPETTGAPFKSKLFPSQEKPSDCFESDQGPASAHQDQRNTMSSRFIEQHSQSVQHDEKRETPSQRVEDNRGISLYPFMMQKSGPPPPQFTSLNNPAFSRFGAPMPNFPGQRGPTPLSLPGQNSPSNNDEQQRPSLTTFVGQQSNSSSFFSGLCGQPPRFGDSRRPLISHHPEEKGASPSQLDHSRSRTEFQDSPFEHISRAPSQFDGLRGPGPLQFMGNRGPPPFPYDNQRNPPPSQFQPHPGPHVPHQFGGMRGSAPNHFGVQRGPPPNKFEDQTGSISNQLPVQIGSSPNQFEEQSNLQPTFGNQRESSQRKFEGPNGPRLSRFSDTNEPPSSRFSYQEPSPQNTPPSRCNYQEQSPQSIKSPRPLELPSYSPQQHKEAWEQGGQSDSLTNFSGERIEPESQRLPTEFGEGKEHDDKTQDVEARQREREEGSNKDKTMDQQDPHSSDNRQGRGFDERRGGRVPRGSWNRDHGRNWNRERDWDRNRDGDRTRDWERNRDWDARQRDRDTNREWDKNRDRDQHRDRDRDKDLEKNKESERNRERTRCRDRGKDSSKRRERERSRSKDRDRNRDPDREDRERFRDQDRERNRDRDRERDRPRERDRDRDRDRVRERDRDRDRERGSDRDRDRGKDHKERSTSKESSRDLKPEGQKEMQRPTETQAASSTQQT